ncbi:hypothetical protein N7462_002989 [Penicillium macrosclerotiorum]|uniref:uncharacterized protein n=1 Tax=Penicillium macrosclerotiorum TaxID=303699 RepID=UPI0025496B24|nr:uncharacterized protein N7462_002989 [Penicillium macrosclerotiorum]KAJ5688597.1 hypothetical protein N7462_002989 [Penicillium macrosclerotiorum]
MADPELQSISHRRLSAGIKRIPGGRELAPQHHFGLDIAATNLLAMASSTAVDSLASALVARFLRTYNYAETLKAFIHEAGLAPDVGQTSGDDTNGLTIQSLLEEKKIFDHSVNFERYGKDNRETDLWSVPAPSKPTIVSTPTSSNLLSASVELWEHSGVPARPSIISAGADRQVHLLATAPENAIQASFSGLSDSPVLSYASILHGRYVFLTNMSGHLLLQRGSQVLDCKKDHAKYAIKVIAHQQENTAESQCAFWVATAGWDATVLVYRVVIPDENSASSPVIGEPIKRIKLATNPESLLFVRHIYTGELLLVLSRRDSTYLYYYEVESVPTETGHDNTAQESHSTECRLLGKQNLAPHSNAWVTFSPSHLALSPHDPGLLAVATSSEPHMKLIIVRLLFPSTKSVDKRDVPAAEATVTQASQALEALALQNREDAAILVQANTFAPQTAYSTPQVVWRPDGSGVWVNGDDGVVRGIETKTGKIISTLKNGHEPGCKVRTIWAGHVDVSGEGEDPAQEEWVISGGFDKRLVVWKV